MEYTTKQAIQEGLDPLKLGVKVDFEWVRTLPIRDGMKVLDVGCFKGRDLRQLWADFPGCILTGVDDYAPAIEYCEQKHADIGATWVVAEAQSLPFKDKEFDVVYENGLIADNPDPKVVKAIKAEMERVGKAVYYSGG